ncbi:MAG: hypothetical protein WBF01_14090, partial [Candidatus Acidiferrum sp.]
KSLFVLFVSHPVTIFSPTRNRAGNFSVARLMEFLTALRHDVEITARPLPQTTRCPLRRLRLNLESPTRNRAMMFRFGTYGHQAQQTRRDSPKNR